MGQGLAKRHAKGQSMITSAGGTPYAIGKVERSRGRFHLRVIRFGKLAASYERRPGEEIRAITKLVVADTPSRPVTVTITVERASGHCVEAVGGGRVLSRP
jgi:hypothetical protein